MLSISEFTQTAQKRVASLRARRLILGQFLGCKIGFVGQIAEEVLSGIRTVLAFNAQEAETRRYESPLFDGYKSGVRKARDFSFCDFGPKAAFRCF